MLLPCKEVMRNLHLLLAVTFHWQELGHTWPLSVGRGGGYRSSG